MMINRIIAVVFFLILSVSLVFSQASCELIMIETFYAVDENCGELSRNEVCYGSNFVNATFQPQTVADTFTEPSDIAQLTDLISIRTSPITDDNVGIAVMTLQANIPNVLPGQNVTFIMIGDMTIENAVDPDDVVDTPIIDIVVNVSSGANLRSLPKINSTVVGGATMGTILQADALSEDHQWLRVNYTDQITWISRSTIQEIDTIDTLPTIETPTTQPMQSFYLRSGIGVPSCENFLSDVLVVQGPKNFEIEFTVNGAEVILGSTAIFRTIEQDGVPFLEILVVDGQIEVEGMTIYSGQSSVLCLGDENSRGLDGFNNDLIVTCGPTQPEFVPNFGRDWCNAEFLPPNVLNYPIDIICPGEIVRVIASK